MSRGLQSFQILFPLFSIHQKVDVANQKNLWLLPVQTHVAQISV